MAPFAPSNPVQNVLQVALVRHDAGSCDVMFVTALNT
jgi:hypothetical protein